MNLSESTRREFYKFYHTSREPQEEGSYINDMVIFVSKPTMMLGIQVTREIVNLLRTIANILEVTSSPSNHGNRRWYHALARSLSIELWLRTHER